MPSDIPGPIRVIIADDHALFREGTREILARDPEIAVVGEAADGLETLDAVERLRPHVVLADIAMPGLNGIEVTRRIKQSRPEIAVVALTVHDEDPYVIAVLEAGASGYLLKDVHGSELIQAVHAVYGGRPVLHPALTKAVLGHVTLRPASSDGDAKRPTERELEVLRSAARGRSNKEIAGLLELSPRTVQTHLANVFAKLGVASRTGAVVEALRRGWFELEDLR
jgi:two-component system, NarL family, response regulator LiaR